MKWMLILLACSCCRLRGADHRACCFPKQHVATRSLQLHQPAVAVYALIAGPPTWRSSIRSYEPVGKIEGKTHWREVDQHNNGDYIRGRGSHAADATRDPHRGQESALRRNVDI